VYERLIARLGENVTRIIDGVWSGLRHKDPSPPGGARRVLPILRTNLIRARGIREPLRASWAIYLVGHTPPNAIHDADRVGGTIRVLSVVAPGSSRLIAVVSASRETDTFVQACSLNQSWRVLL
jgi:hypothetical protein